MALSTIKFALTRLVHRISAEEVATFNEEVAYKKLQLLLDDSIRRAATARFELDPNAQHITNLIDPDMP